jgi:hypothetical protein
VASSSSDEYNADEISQRLDAGLKRSLTMKPMQHKTKEKRGATTAAPRSKLTQRVNNRGKSKKA